MPYRRGSPELLRGGVARTWIFAGAVLLAGLAGYVNTALLTFFHVPVSHMTGAVSRISADLGSGDYADFQLVVAIPIGFFLGAALTGMIIGRRKLEPGRRYGATLLVEGVLLGIATALLVRDHRTGIAVAATACGIQNAMASSYRGLIIRTTHVTGTVTDLGVMLGYWIRHRRVRPWKAALLAGLLGGFLGGGILGAIATARFGAWSLSIASVSCIAAGIGYVSWRLAVDARGRYRMAA